MKKIDLTKPFELTIKGELMAEDGKKYAAGIYAPGEGLPDKLRVAHYGENVDGENVDTERRPRQAAIFSKPAPAPNQVPAPVPLAVAPAL